jgi:hypothetical protein
VYIISTASFIAQGRLFKGFHCPPGPVAFGALLHQGLGLVINLEAIKLNAGSGENIHYF